MVKTITKEDLDNLVQNAKMDLGVVPRNFDVLVIGEYHPSQPVREHLIQNLEWLKILGINAYGVGAPIKYRMQFQKVYDSYHGGKAYVAPDYVLFGPTPNPKKDESYRNLAHLLAENSIHIFPFDPRQFNKPNNNQNRNGNITAKEEKQITDIIEENVRKYGKTLILAGDLHPRRWKKKPTIANYLEKRGYKCVTITYNGGYTTGMRRVETAAWKENRNNDEFILENSLKLIPPRSDFIIHLPQRIEDKDTLLERNAKMD